MNKYLNLLFFIFILVDAGVLIKKSTESFSAIRSDKTDLHAEANTAKQLPDVYLIVADEYAGGKGLIDLCDFDNRSFFDTLRQRGFFVADSSSSNYNSTTFSMASVLNMDYLGKDADQLRKGGHALPLKLIFDNEVTSRFKDTGYAIYNYSIFDMKDQFVVNKNPFIPSRTALFTSQTLFDRLKKEVWVNALVNWEVKGILRPYLFENFEYNKVTYQKSLDITRSLGTTPKFVYTHLEMPHFPYYYDAAGKLRPEKELWKEQPGELQSYVQYLKYTNRLLIKLVDEIIRSNRTPPVIVLMSDHGQRCFPAGQVSHAFVNFFSVYLPGKNYNQFSDSISNVNVFRALFNTIYNEHLPMLENKYFDVGN